MNTTKMNKITAGLLCGLLCSSVYAKGPIDNFGRPQGRTATNVYPALKEVIIVYKTHFDIGYPVTVHSALHWEHLHRPHSY